MSSIVLFSNKIVQKILKRIPGGFLPALFEGPQLIAGSDHQGMPAIPSTVSNSCWNHVGMTEAAAILILPLHPY